ncbi:MAG: sulfur carrier protein ThiS [Peptococcaceae bacterium]|nr:sulfur carrier protein ThiS [Peptococcaceae bacterium]
MKVNGAEVILREVVRLDMFLVEQGYNPAYVAVEMNGEVVLKSAYDQTILSDSDVIEVVRFVGGG